MLRTMLILREQDVAVSVSYAEATDALEEAYRALAARTASTLSRARLAIPCGTIHLLAADGGPSGAAGVRVGLAGPGVGASLMILYDRGSGIPAALIAS